VIVLESWFNQDSLSDAANRVDASIWLATMDGSLVFVNDHAVRALGLGRADLIRRWTDLLHPADHDFTLGVAEDIFSRREPLSFVCRIRHADGAFRWTQHIAWPVIGRRHGHYLGLSYVLRPGASSLQPTADTVLTAVLREARRCTRIGRSGPDRPQPAGQARPSLVVHKGGLSPVDQMLGRERLHRLATNGLVLAAPSPIVAADRDLRIRAWNRAMEALTGASSKQVLGQKAIDIFPFLQENGVVDKLRRTLNGEANESRGVYAFSEPIIATVRRRPIYGLAGVVEGVVVTFGAYRRLVTSPAISRASAVIAMLAGIIVLALVNAPALQAADVSDLINPFRAMLDAE
jgi:PAS domain S-box-containing protein